MTLHPLINKKSIRTAYNQVAANWRKGAQQLIRKVGWHGGGGEFEVYWRPTEHIWCMLEDAREESRYWCCFGTADPIKANSLAITGEINPTKEGINRRNAGIFVQDNHGIVYLAHSGKVGGGRKGIGKSTFLSFYRGDNIEEVSWPDHISSSAIIIGRIDSDHLPAQIAHFIHEVERFKEAVITDYSLPTPDPSPKTLTFTPEFSGQRKRYTLVSEIEARCDHGVVIEALAEFIKVRGIRFANDQQRDLFLLSSEGAVTHLFELKTDASTSSLYTAIGQLMLHGAAQSTIPKRILILPDVPNERTLSAIRRLNIKIVTYEWINSRPVFHGLEEVL
jgi:hypothetical protein